MRRVKLPVSLMECKRRTLEAMSKANPRHLFRPSEVAHSIWPGESFRSAQGAGFAASAVLAHMIRDGTVYYGRNSY